MLPDLFLYLKFRERIVMKMHQPVFSSTSVVKYVPFYHPPCKRPMSLTESLSHVSQLGTELSDSGPRCQDGCPGAVH